VLKLHQVSHFGEKVYKCTICNETFGSKKTMELHIKKHPESPASVTSTVTDGSVSSPVAIGSPVEPEVSQEAASGGNLGPVAIPASPSLPSIAVDDKENLKTEEAYPDSTSNAYAVQRDFTYYLYSGNREQQQYPQPLVAPSSAVEPVLPDVDEKRFQANVVVSAPLEPVAAHHVFFYPDPAYGSFSLTASNGIDLDATDCSSFLNLPGNDARRRVEAALEAVEEERQRQEYSVEIVKVDRDPLLTPPCSNPESPVSSPDLALDLAIPPRETLILPPRKRSKMILQSMESEYRSSGDGGGGLIATSQRQNSVIQFARAS